jgi:hypothetical protein
MTTAAAAKPKRRALAEIVEELYNAVQDAEGDIDLELDIKLEALGLELEDKAEAYVAVMRRLEAEAKEFARLSEYFATLYDAKQSARLKQRDNLKQRLFGALLVVGVTELKTKTTKVWMQETERLEVVGDEYETHVNPLECAELSSWVVEPVPTKKLDRAALKAALLSDNPPQLTYARIVRPKHLRYS